ncbi:VWA-like domain-containing protein [Xanthocytophaga agilis]|uniref:VWA-like domain-containing protein n=1 Tax=Xanthocytophaga agilis TaxID=3048010 RepID=A0AAE3R0N7_9BACT|nr:VWA-like domain-containing protein [Xanthocytophaga agilis]MDJ1499179.1 VWA-like domain-containing protein [Xanthocytophaga agilis]
MAQSPSVGDISRICIQLLLKEPFYGHFLMGIPKEFSDKIKTAAVALYKKQMIKLMVNAEFWNSLSEIHQYGLIKHEVLHIVLRHLILQKSFPQKRLFNIAADLVINQYIQSEQLPEGGLTLEMFQPLLSKYGITLEKKQGVDYYYQQLAKVMHSVNSSGEGCSDPIFTIFNEDNDELDKHSYWDEFRELESGELKVMEHQLKRLTKTTLDRVKPKNWGGLPLDLVEALQQIVLEEPKINWKRALRLFAASSNSTYVKNTIRRASKRYGTVPGIKLKRRQELLIAIDTSGSINLEEVQSFFQEIYHIWRQGCIITIVECDAKIHREYEFKGKFPADFQGGGGNDYTEAVELANKTMPDGLIYFTDGHVSTPDIKPRMPALWVISVDGSTQYRAKDERVIQMN